MPSTAGEGGAVASDTAARAMRRADDQAERQLVAETGRSNRSATIVFVHSLSGLPHRLASAACLSGLPQRPASAAGLSGRPQRPACRARSGLGGRSVRSGLGGLAASSGFGGITASTGRPTGLGGLMRWWLGRGKHRVGTRRLSRGAPVAVARVPSSTVVAGSMEAPPSAALSAVAWVSLPAVQGALQREGSKGPGAV